MVAPIEVKINGDVSGFENALVEGSKHVKVFGQDVGVKLPPKLNLAVQGVKVAAKVTKKLGGAAKDAAAEEAIFQDSMSAVAGEGPKYNEMLNETIKASQKKAFTDTETRKALLALSTATGDASVATGLLTTAQDVARVAGVDLEAASDAVAKAYAGQDTALLRMLPGLEKGATGMDTINNATKLAEGASDSYADSATATGEKAKIAFSEIAETLGSLLIPILEGVGAVLKPIITIFAQLVSIFLPRLTRMFERWGKVLEKVADVLQWVSDAIGKVIAKIKELLEPLTEAVDKMRDLLPGGKSAGGGAAGAVTSMTQVAARGVEQTANRNGRAGVTINIYGDPAVIEARVTKALRDYARRNGAAAIFTPERT